MRRRRPSWNPYRDEFYDSNVRRQFAGAAAASGPSQAAVGALALLSFAFFLNIIQQQIQNGPPSFNRMVNGTNSTVNGTSTGNGTQSGGGGGVGNFTRPNRRPNRRPNKKKRRRPAVIALAVNNKNGVKRRPQQFAANTVKKGKRKPKPAGNRRKPRDLQNELQQSDWDDYEEDEDDELESENYSPIMMPGLPHAGSMQLSAWMQGTLEGHDLKYDLVDTLTNCRAVIACTSYRAAKETDRESPSYISDTSLKKILDEAGEYAELGELNEACEDLLQASGEECSLLAQSLGKLSPDLVNVKLSA